MIAFVWASVALYSLVILNQLVLLSLSDDVRKRSAAAIGIVLNVGFVVWGLVVLGVFG